MSFPGSIRARVRRSAARVAHLLNVPRPTLDKFIAAGKIHCVTTHTGAHRQIDLASVDAFVAAQCAAHDVPMRPLEMIAGEPPLLRVEDVSRLLSYSERHIRMLADTGKLQGFKMGRAWFFWRSDFTNAPSEQTAHAQMNVVRCG